MKTLDDIAIECQTDRASKFTRTYGKPHNYAVHYDLCFCLIRDEPVRLLEIGVGGGEGIRMWLDYFRNDATQIYGVDSVKDTNDWDTAGVMASIESRYFFTHGDQGDAAFWDRFLHFYSGDGFDIIIDDGSHINTDIITTFIALWQYVKPGGFYAIEDLATGYGGDSFFVKPNLPSHIDFLKGKLDELNKGTSDIDSIYWAKELCIIRKAL